MSIDGEYKPCLWRSSTRVALLCFCGPESTQSEIARLAGCKMVRTGLDWLVVVPLGRAETVCADSRRQLSLTARLDIQPKPRGGGGEARESWARGRRGELSWIDLRHALP